MKVVLTILTIILYLVLSSSSRFGDERPASLGMPSGSFYALLVLQASEVAGASS